jgi:hypothetical protein
VITRNEESPVDPLAMVLAWLAQEYRCHAVKNEQRTCESESGSGARVDQAKGQSENYHRDERDQRANDSYKQRSSSSSISCVFAYPAPRDARLRSLGYRRSIGGAVGRRLTVNEALQGRRQGLVRADADTVNAAWFRCADVRRAAARGHVLTVS